MGGQTRQSRAASVCFADGFPCGGGLFGVRQPHRYGRAYARFTLDAQAVGIAEAVLQPAVNIPDAHMAVFGGGLLEQHRNFVPQRTLRVGFYAYTGYHVMDKDGQRGTAADRPV